MSKVIIFGIGHLAEMALFYLNNDSEHDVVAFTVDPDYLNTDNFHKLPVVNFNEIEKKFPPNEFKMFIPISYKKINKIRAEKYTDAKKKGYKLNEWGLYKNDKSISVKNERDIFKLLEMDYVPPQDRRQTIDNRQHTIDNNDKIPE